MNTMCTFKGGGGGGVYNSLDQNIFHWCMSSKQIIDINDIAEELGEEIFIDNRLSLGIDLFFSRG